MRRASKFLHPSVLQIFDYGEARGMCFVVIELFRGTSLAAVLEERRFVKIREAVSVARQLVSALDYAREQGAALPWISPAGVLVSPEHVVKLKLFREPGTTPRGIEREDAPYVAPELLGRVTRGQDESALVYGVGAILYHMLAGIPPVEGETTEEIAIRARKDSPPGLRRINLKVSPALATVVESSLDHDPKRRPQTLRELQIALDKASSPGR